jgi:hypothetical protein
MVSLLAGVWAATAVLDGELRGQPDPGDDRRPSLIAGSHRATAGYLAPGGTVIAVAPAHAWTTTRRTHADALRRPGHGPPEPAEGRRRDWACSG